MNLACAFNIDNFANIKPILKILLFTILIYKIHIYKVYMLNDK